MPPTSVSSPKASPAACSPPDPPWPAPGGICAIHQPNLFPRLSTLAKLFTADYWIVLDDVQFTRRDYQHRTHLAALDDPARTQWLSISTHLPHGRATLINQARITDPHRCARRILERLSHHYEASAHWPALRQHLPSLLDLFTTTDRTARVAEASTRTLLDMLGWTGTILRSSDLPARPGRSQRLADLATATHARTYLCGTGGMRYLDLDLFQHLVTTVTPFRTPDTGLWTNARTISALWTMMKHGPSDVVEALLRNAKS
jgi:hypothetical protein